MNSIGIIAEYNPLHNGHIEQLNYLKSKYPNTPIIICMSGSFVQRGEPALFDKFKRTTWALNNGADLVIELPSYFAVANAECFATGAIQLLHRIGINHCSFGSETDDLNTLTDIAKISLSAKFQLKCLELIKSGLSYSNALREALKLMDINFIHLINSPNNILAIEYIKASIKHNLNLNFIPIKRHSDHHNKSLCSNELPSGSAIRNYIYTNYLANKVSNLPTLQHVLPANTYRDITTFIKNGDFVNINRYNDALLLKSKLTSTEDLHKLQDFEEGLENAWTNASIASSWPEALNTIKSRRYTFSRLNRMAAYTLLNRDKNTFNKIQEIGPQYARILGFNDNGRAWLKNADSKIPLITKWGAFFKTTKGLTRQMAEADILATNLQSFCLHNENLRKSDMDFHQNIIYIKNNISLKNKP